MYLKVDVIYSQSSGSAIRKTLKNYDKKVRIEPMVSDTLMAIWIDIDAGHHVNNGQEDNYHTTNRLKLLGSVFDDMTAAGHEPFVVPHVIPQRPRSVVIDYITGELFFHKKVKEYHEVLSFGDECKNHLLIKYDALADGKVQQTINIENVWLIGNHYTVRKAKRFIANKLSNGGTLCTSDLERIKQLMGSQGRVYMLSIIGRLIDIMNATVVCSGGYMPGERDLKVTNSQVIHTGKFVERIRDNNNYDHALRTAATR